MSDVALSMCRTPFDQINEEFVKFGEARHSHTADFGGGEARHKYKATFGGPASMNSKGSKTDHQAIEHRPDAGHLLAVPPVFSPICRVALLLRF